MEIKSSQHINNVSKLSYNKKPSCR